MQVCLDRVAIEGAADAVKRELVPSLASAD
jgi:hypothetical protein